MADTYTRIVLTVIALALVTIALRLGASPVPAAWADGTQVVRIDGPIEVRPIDIDTFRGKVPVEVTWSFNSAGSSRSSPLYTDEVE